MNTSTRHTLHTTHATLARYAQIARDQLTQLEKMTQAMADSNSVEAETFGLPLFDRLYAQSNHLAERLEYANWIGHHTQNVNDALYLLAAGDNGPAACAAADPEGRSRQAHHERRRQAIERLTERGCL